MRDESRCLSALPSKSSVEIFFRKLRKDDLTSHSVLTLLSG